MNLEASCSNFPTNHHCEERSYASQGPYGFGEYHATTMDNPVLPKRRQNETESAWMRRYRKRSEGRAAMMTRLLLKLVEITVSGEPKNVTALEAILLQLRAKELSDHPRASSIRPPWHGACLRAMNGF
jgi:hypothetical protein